MIRRMPGRLGWGSWGMSNADREELKLLAAAMLIQARMVWALAETQQLRETETQQLREIARFMHQGGERAWDVLAPTGSRNEERQASLACLLEILEEEPSGSQGEPE